VRQVIKPLQPILMDVARIITVIAEAKIQTAGRTEPFHTGHETVAGLGDIDKGRQQTGSGRIALDCKVLNSCKIFFYSFLRCSLSKKHEQALCPGSHFRIGKGKGLKSLQYGWVRFLRQ
jgi:hypothetical protein